jgi:hypothetical protein
MKLKQLQKPTQKVVSLEEIKDHLRIDGTAEDNLLTRIIDACTERLEQHCNQKFLAQDWVQYLDFWPKSARDIWWDGVREVPVSELYGEASSIQLLIGPVIEVIEFNTYSDSGVPVLFPPTSYIVDNTGPWGRISLPMGGVWPTTILRKTNAIEIKFKAGMATTPDQLPAGIKQAVLSLAAYYYEHRGDEKQVKLPLEVGLLIAPYKFERIGLSGH